MKVTLQIVVVVGLLVLFVPINAQDDDQDSEEEFYLNHGINITKLPLTGLKLSRPTKEYPGWMEWLPLGEKLTGSPALGIGIDGKIGIALYSWVDENLFEEFQPKIEHKRICISVKVCETPKQARQLLKEPEFADPLVVNETLGIGDVLLLLYAQDLSDESKIGYLRFVQNNVVIRVSGKVKDWTAVKVARLIDKHLQETAFKGKPEDIKRPKIEKFNTDKKVLKAEPGEGFTVTIKAKDTQKILAVKVGSTGSDISPVSWNHIVIPTHQEFETKEVEVKVKEKENKEEKEYEVEVKLRWSIDTHLPGLYKLYASAINESNVASEDAIIEIELKEEDKK